MAELINTNDSLNQGRKKLNDSIKQSERAEGKSDQAINTSNEAKNTSQTAEEKADSVQEQFNQVVIDGDSSLEAAQARVDEKGQSHSTLKQRIDKGFSETASQLAQIALNLKSFGAVGDGVANDTTSFVEAINFLSQKGGGTLVVPTGDYLIDPDVIQLKSNVHIVGTGKSRIFTDHGKAYEFMFGNHTEEVRNIEITGLEFDQIKEVGRFEPQTNTLPTRMISIYSPVDVHINNNHFNNLFGQHAILSGYWENSEGNYIKDNRVTCNRFLPNTSEMYDASAIYVDDKYHEISGNIIKSIKTDYHWWKIPGAIETHGRTGVVKDNIVENAYIFLNISGDPHLEREDEGHLTVYGNKVINVHKGISLWTRKNHEEYSDLKPIENLHIFDNTIILDITFTAKGNFAVGFEPQTSTGVLKNMTINNNIVIGQTDYDNYDGVQLLSTYGDFTAFQLSKLRGEVENVTIENNLIKNFGGGVLSTGQNNQSNLTVKNVSFRNNKIIDPLLFPFLGPYHGLFDIGVGENIDIVDNEIEFTSKAKMTLNVPEVWLLSIGDTVKKFTYLNNKQIEGNVALGRVKTNDIHNEEYNVDVGDYLRIYGKPKTSFIASTSNPTEGTYYTNHSLLYVGVPYNEGFRGKMCAQKGTSGSNPSSANRKYLKQFESLGKYSMGSIIDFGGAIVTIVGKNGNDYYIHEDLPEISNTTINYSKPVWYDMETQ